MIFFYRLDDNNLIEEAEERKAFQRRNMLMNIILRPGGGDKTRALPRPKVDVRADGPNVIIIRMTFPDNENIQGLRAYTPNETADLNQLNKINEILPPNTSVERITAQSGEEIDYNYDDYDYNNDYRNDYNLPLTRPVRQNSQGYFVPPVTTTPTPTIPTPPPLPIEPLTRPTRPPRPHKVKVQHLPPKPPSHPGPPPKKSKRPRGIAKRPKAVHPPPPPVPPKPKFKKGKKPPPKLYIKSSLKAGTKNFDYNVAVDRNDWKPLPAGYHPAYHPL